MKGIQYNTRKHGRTSICRSYHAHMERLVFSFLGIAQNRKDLLSGGNLETQISSAMLSLHLASRFIHRLTILFPLRKLEGSLTRITSCLHSERWSISRMRGSFSFMMQRKLSAAKGIRARLSTKNGSGSKAESRIFAPSCKARRPRNYTLPTVCTFNVTSCSFGASYPATKTKDLGEKKMKHIRDMLESA